MASSQGGPPEAVPEERVAVPNNSADSQFREIIKHAQRLLSEYSPITDAVESHQGKDSFARRITACTPSPS